jgi:hypothetical protein
MDGATRAFDGGGKSVHHAMALARQLAGQLQAEGMAGIFVDKQVHGRRSQDLADERQILFQVNGFGDCRDAAGGPQALDLRPD